MKVHGLLMEWGLVSEVSEGESVEKGQVGPGRTGYGTEGVHFFQVIFVLSIHFILPSMRIIHFDL